jgi:hypothetical protein
MKQVTLFALFALLATAATALFAQGFSIGVGAVAGSYSASKGIAVIGLTGPGTADASVIAKNEGTGTANVSAGLSVVPPIVPLAATGTGTSQNTTTVTPTLNLPAGGTGNAGGAGAGATFAAVGVQGMFVTVGPIPSLPTLLPVLPVFSPLP